MPSSCWATTAPLAPFTWSCVRRPSTGNGSGPVTTTTSTKRQAANGSSNRAKSIWSASRHPKPTDPQADRGELAMENLRIISADSHVVEPADLWETRLDRKYREQAPNAVRD